MQATQTPPQLPGSSASKPYLVLAFFYGGVVLLVGALTALMSVVPNPSSGHLPSAVDQWALTNVAGMLATFAVSVLIAGPPLIASQRHILRRRFLARAAS